MQSLTICYFSCFIIHLFFIIFLLPNIENGSHRPKHQGYAYSLIWKGSITAEHSVGSMSEILFALFLPVCVCV